MDHYGTGIGRTLCAERERRRVSLETISRATMIRKEYLELIDTDQLERLPPGAYAKGFIRAYATYLGLDARPLTSAYEKVYEGNRELAAAVRHPVRVPDPVAPKTWRTAAGAGISLLVLLGLLGVVRSGEPTAKAPMPSTAEIAALSAGGLNADRTPASPAPNPAGAVVRVEVVGPQAWVQAEQDGTVIFAATMKRGQKKVFRGGQAVYLVIGNARAVKLLANGNDVGTPPGSTYRGTFTPTTSDLPPSQAR